MSSLFGLCSDAIGGIWSALRADAGGEGLLPLLRPVPPYDLPPLFSPVTTLATLLGLAVLSAAALGAFGLLFAASLGIYLILTEVLGISIELKPFRV